MLKVRLQRVGRKNDPSFRVVVTDSKRGPKSGDYIEMVGSHNPRTKQTQIKEDRIQHWLGVGAKASPTVHNMLVKEKIVDGKMINVLPKKSPIVKGDKEEGESTKDSAKAEAKSARPAGAEDKDGEVETKDEASADDSKDEGAEEAPTEVTEDTENTSTPSVPTESDEENKL